MRRTSRFYRRVVRRRHYVSEEYIASVFRAEELSLPPVLLVSWFAYSSTLNMEAICSSETLGCLRTTYRCSAEHHAIHSHRRSSFLNYECLNKTLAILHM
jgi:hypothetical protein